MWKPEIRKTIWASFLLTFVLISMSATSLSAPLNTIQSNGTIYYPSTVEISVVSSNKIGENNMSLGFMLDWDRWITFTKDPALMVMAQAANFKLVRIFDFRPTVPRLMPCTYWNESTKTGTWNWSNVDNLVQKIFQMGGEPFFCLGWARDNIQNYLPPGMAVDPNTGLPYLASYASYAAEWVKHFQDVGLPVRYYEIMDEPYFYFGWNGSNATRLADYVTLWNITAESMRQQNPNVLISQDSITMTNVFYYWLTHGDDVNFLDFHKYDEDTLNEFTIAQMFSRAESRQFLTDSTFYGINDARQKWFAARGNWLPAINSESNFDDAYANGTDPNIQQMTGAVWLALVLRMGILQGLNYNVYFELCSSKSWQQSQGTGWGFGMIDEDNDQPWYPYLLQKMVGANLGVGDSLIETSSSSDNVRCVGWIHDDGKLNVLIVCKTADQQVLMFSGLNGNISISLLDNTTSADNPQLQTVNVQSNSQLLTKGYTVALLQSG